MTRARGVALLLALALGGCMSKRVCTPAGGLAAGPPPPDWREVVTDRDHDKLRSTRTAFVDGLNAARAAGFGTQIAAQGPLLDPDRAIDAAAMPPGNYRCTTFTLGSKSTGRPAFYRGSTQSCSITPAERIERLRETGGPQRLTGRIYSDGSARSIFLGVRMLADEPAPIHYGRDDIRDVAGAIQRVDDRRWRLTVPKPSWEAMVDIVDIVPA